MQTILITGGTGLVGRALSEFMTQRGYKVIILSRAESKSSQNNNITYAKWDINNNYIDIDAIKKADCIIHLAGAGVMDKKWTTDYKKEIIDSRTISSRLLIQALRQCQHNVKAVISSSAIGYYGKDEKPGYFFDEDDEADNSFLGNTCKLWEASIEPVKELKIRLVKFRIGIVLSKQGGALAEFIKPLKLRIAAILGNGQQMVSWIHINDLCRLFLFAIENQNMQGVFNAVAPTPVSNKYLTLSLAKIIAPTFYIPIYVPAFLLKLILGSKSIEVLKSTTVSCQKLINTGFTFLHSTIGEALITFYKSE
ncbi:MAG: TIGR01777 family protein [Chitinophagaceae bacterium]|nr:TIGR01777 family protein [Chitinophagaceae bacterium]